MKKLLIVFALIFVSTYSLYSQNKIMKGKVISEFFETIPGVLITINDTIKIGSTDSDGFFQIEISVSEKNISFGFIGLEPTTIQLSDTCDEIEIVMMSNATYDFISLKKADRLRMKRFKKLPAIHKEAYCKGLFNTENQCYTQQFVAYSKKE